MSSSSFRVTTWEHLQNDDIFTFAQHTRRNFNQIVSRQISEIERKDNKCI